MNRIAGFFLLCMTMVVNGSAQFGKMSPADSIHWANIRKLTEQDYRNMLEQLHIDSTRPGPSGNPQAPNAANADESKVFTNIKLPDPLILNDGQPVTTAKMWWEKRRPEIVEYFDRDVYGRVPANVPKVTWELVSSVYDTSNHVPAITRKLIGHVDNSSYPAISVNIDLTICTPANIKTPVPLIMEFGFIFPPGFKFPASATGLTGSNPMAAVIIGKRLGLCDYRSCQLPGR